MLKYYDYIYSVWKDGKELTRRRCGSYLQEESEAKDTTYEVSWDNLTEFYHEHSIFLPFNVWKIKRGLTIEFFNPFFQIKQWKEPNLKLTIKQEYRENECVSIQQILEYYDAEKAIQYLKERGLSIVAK